MVSSRVVLFFAGAGMLAACAAEPATFLQTANHPASPKAMETPVIAASHALDPSAAAAEIGSSVPAGHASPSASQPGVYYTCIMNPEIHQDHPGTCPICGMTLVKREVSPEEQKGAAK